MIKPIAPLTSQIRQEALSEPWISENWVPHAVQMRKSRLEDMVHKDYEWTSAALTIESVAELQEA